jgi:hypothetical protein
MMGLTPEQDKRLWQERTRRTAKLITLDAPRCVVAADAMIWLDQYGFWKLYRHWLWLHYWLRWRTDLRILWQRKVKRMTWDEIESELLEE